MKEKFSKLANVYKKYGFVGFMRKLYAYIIANYLDKFSFRFLFERKKYSEELDGILSGDFDRVVLWRSSFGYNVPLFQRPQHIARNLKSNGCLVLYEVTTMTDRVKIFKKQENNLYLFNYNNVALNKMLMQKLKKVNKPKYVQLYSTDWKLAVKNIEAYMAQGFGFIYEYIDHLSPELAGTKVLPQNIIEKYEYAMSNKNVFLVYSASELERDVLEKRGREKTAFVSNGVDYDFFKKLDRDFSFDEEFNRAIDTDKITIGYYGALAKWFDYELIKKIDATDKYRIILFGIKYDESFDESGIDKCKNVFFLGPRDYKVLKNYAANIDILTIPFVINDITKATSPLKLFEYMALGKPIVTTDMLECRKYSSVFIGESHEDFIDKLQTSYEKRKDPDYLKLLEKEGRENDWSVKTADIINLIKEYE